ncbi:hypothetical protein, partial [Cryobacterium roopkundense]|uniref:hypothetical protein n=1 Tax=Cryobacterium roopkundense TaxID=1001240 RepID=UPI0005682617
GVWHDIDGQIGPKKRNAGPSIIKEALAARPMTREPQSRRPEFFFFLVDEASRLRFPNRHNWMDVAPTVR